MYFVQQNFPALQLLYMYAKYCTLQQMLCSFHFWLPIVTFLFLVQGVDFHVSSPNREPSQGPIVSIIMFPFTVYIVCLRDMQIMLQIL